MPQSKDSRFWNKMARKYAGDPIADQAGYDRSLTRYREFLTPQTRVLELGCGTGSTALLLAPDAASYLATDLSDEMIAIAREKPDASAGLTFRTATAEDITPQDGPFDVILGCNYLHMVRDLPATLRQIHDLTAPGGVFLSKTPCVGDMSPLIRLALPVMQLLGKAPHVLPLTAPKLEQNIKDAGFTIDAVEYHGTKGKDVRPVIIARKT